MSDIGLVFVDIDSTASNSNLNSMIIQMVLSLRFSATLARVHT